MTERYILIFVIGFIVGGFTILSGNERLIVAGVVSADGKVYRTQEIKP